MIRFALFVSAALVLMAPAAQALTVLEDRAAFDAASSESFFDDYEEGIDVADGDVIGLGSQVVRGPVTYATSTGGQVAAIGTNTFAQGSIRLAPSTSNASFDIDISFDGGVTAIGFDLQSLLIPDPIVSEPPFTHKISLFDRGGSEIGELTKTVGTTAMFVGILSDVEIGHIVIDDQDGSGFGSVIDNLSLGTNTSPMTPIPLPASGLLLLTALIGGGFSTRRARPAA